MTGQYYAALTFQSTPHERGDAYEKDYTDCPLSFQSTPP